jgi:hypothetical protein
MKHSASTTLKMRKELNSKSAENISLKRWMFRHNDFVDQHLTRKIPRANDQLGNRVRNLEKDLERERSQKFHAVTKRERFC